MLTFLTQLSPTQWTRYFPLYSPRLQEPANVHKVKEQGECQEDNSFTLLTNLTTNEPLLDHAHIAMASGDLVNLLVIYYMINFHAWQYHRIDWFSINEGFCRSQVEQLLYIK
jgi:hypothetical protein